MDGSSNYAVAFEDDLAKRRPAEEQLQKTLSFIIEHETVLHNIIDATRIAIIDANDTHYRPLRVAHEATEKVYPQDLMSTDNDILRKVNVALVFLVDEVHELKETAITKLFGPLIMFGQVPPSVDDCDDDSNNDASSSAGSSSKKYREIMIGRFLPTLQEVSNFIDRCYSVALNIVQQLSSLMNPKDALYRASFASVHLTTVFQSLGDILSTLLTLDCIVEQNELLTEAWSFYKSLISYARADPAAFNSNDAGVVKFERLLVSIDQSVMIGEIYKGCIEQNYESTDDGEDGEIFVHVRSNALFLDELLYSIKHQLESSIAVIGTNHELFERYDIISCLALYALYRKLLPANVAPDVNLHKTLWSIQKTVPFVVVCEKVVWNLGEFLQRHAPFEIKKPDPPNPVAYRRTYINQFDLTLTQKTASLQQQIAAWLVLTESKFQGSIRHESNMSQALDIRGSILLKGLALASRAEYLAKSCLVMHSHMQIPLNKANLNDVALLVENLKAIEFTFIRKDLVISESSHHIRHTICEAIASLIQPLSSKLSALTAEAVRTGKRTKIDSGRYDLLSLLNTIVTILQSSDSFSYVRQAVLRLSCDIIEGSKLLNEKESARLKSYVLRLCAIANISYNIRKVCNTSFLYFDTAILSPIVSHIYQLPTEAARLQYIIAAFNDGIKMFQMILHTDTAQFYINYRSIIRTVITKEIIQPLSRDIETDLRLHIHTKHLDHMQALNPKTENFHPLKPFLAVPPLHLLGLIINIKNEVTHYLDLNFYNLTTVALHDWRTYSDMRSLAEEKLGIHLMDNFLPMGSLDQGLDVLQIMRNINIFVSRFTYNMNTQQFIEYRPTSKHINTIKIQSIAASIRQHGLGVLNTTVNFTYQFLAQKFHIFSQFLFDDYIKAHLSREVRWYKKHKHESNVNNMYPYDHALSLVKDIRKLGVNETGKTFLDQFRILITEIGNALGYVRMVRSASMYYCSEAVKFLPEIDEKNIISFEMHAGNDDITPSPPQGDSRKGAGFSDETVKAGKILDDVVSCLIQNFGEGSDYFKVLVNVFQSVLLTQEHDHLRTFYMIVPSLCISWLEASLQAKEAVYKVARGPTKEMYFTDDGFAMGIAYCLAILKQTRKHDSLHWVDTVRQKHKIDSKKLEEQQAVRMQKELKQKEQKSRSSSIFGALSSLTGKKAEIEEQNYEDMEEVHSLQMTGKRLEAQRRETEQLFYAMSGAGIFFRRTDVENS